MAGSAVNFPSSSNSLGKIIQSTDAPYTESYTISASDPAGAYKHRIGTGLVPAQPATWKNIPKGVFPLDPPAAPTLGSPSGYATSAAFLTTGVTYKWLCTFVTDYGETQAGGILTASTGTNTAVNLALPSLNGSGTNPIRAIRLYRNTQADQNTFRFVQQINDLRLTTYLDTAADTIIQGNITPPSTNLSGSIGVVTIQGTNGSGGSTWTEVAQGSESVAGQFSIAYDTGPLGGVITHAPADSGQVVTIQYTAATLASADVMNDIIGAIQDTAAMLGSDPRNGYADLTTRLTALDTKNSAQDTQLSSYNQIQNYLISGGIPPLPGSGVQVQMPATTVVINIGTQAVTVSKSAQSLNLGANCDSFVDLDSGGNYHVLTNGAVGDTVPAKTANSIRLFKASANTTITSITQVAATKPFGAYLPLNSYVIAGGNPSVPGSGLTISVPATIAVINDFTTSVTIINPTLNVVVSANADNYVDLADDGTYHITPKTIGGSAPSVYPHSIRLFKATTNSGSVVSITSLYSQAPFGNVIADTLTIHGHLLPRDGSPTLTNHLTDLSGTATIDFDSSVAHSDSSGRLVLDPHGSLTVAPGHAICTVNFQTAFNAVPKPFVQGMYSPGFPSDLTASISVNGILTTSFTVYALAGFTINTPAAINYSVFG